MHLDGSCRVLIVDRVDADACVWFGWFLLLIIRLTNAIDRCDRPVLQEVGLYNYVLKSFANMRCVLLLYTPSHRHYYSINKPTRACAQTKVSQKRSVYSFQTHAIGGLFYLMQQNKAKYIVPRCY